MKLKELKKQLTQEDFEIIEELSSQNHSPSEIGKSLNVPLKAFLHLWRDHNSEIRKAYERGVLSMEVIKTAELKKKAETGSVTAIQMHDKKAKQQRFEDAKRDIFGFND